MSRYELSKEYSRCFNYGFKPSIAKNKSDWELYYDFIKLRFTLSKVLRILQDEIGLEDDYEEFNFKTRSTTQKGLEEVQNSWLDLIQSFARSSTNPDRISLARESKDS